MKSTIPLVGNLNIKRRLDRDDPQTTFQGRKDSEIAVVLGRFERLGKKNKKKDQERDWPDHEAPANRNLQFLLEKAGVRIPVLPENKPPDNTKGYGPKGIIYINAYPRKPKNLSATRAASKIKKHLICRKLVIVAGGEAKTVVRLLKKNLKNKNVEVLYLPHPSYGGVRLLGDLFECWKEVRKSIKHLKIKIHPCPKEKKVKTRKLPEWKHT